MNNAVNNMVVVNNTEIMAKEWNGERVVTLAEIDKVHNRKKGAAKARFTYHREHMIEGTDYYMTTIKEFNNVFGSSRNPKGNPNLPMALITKSGYLMLVKVMDDPEAWRVQRDLVNAYFLLENIVEQKKKEEVNRKNEIVKQKQQPVQNPETDLKNVMLEINKFLEYEQKKNDDFRDTMMKGFAVLSSLVMNQNKMFETWLEQINTTQKQNMENNGKLENHINEKDNLDNGKTALPINIKPAWKPYSEWKRELLDLIGNRNQNYILSETYNYMTKRYGVCWKQLEKDYASTYGNKPHSNMYLAWWMEKNNEACRNLTISCVDTIIKSMSRPEIIITKEAEEKPENKVVTKLSDVMPAVKIISEVQSKYKKDLYPVDNVEELKELAEYLISELKDNSPHGVVFYRKFFRFVNSIESIEWKEFEEKYREEFNRHSKHFRVSKLMMMEHFKEIEKKCVRLFNQYVKENYMDVLK